MFFTKKSEKGASLKYLKKIRKKVNNKNNRHRKNSRDIWQRRGWLNRDNGREKNNYFSNFQHFVKWSLSKKQEIFLNFWGFFQCCQRQPILPCKTSREVIFLAVSQTETTLMMIKNFKFESERKRIIPGHFYIIVIIRKRK